MRALTQSHTVALLSNTNEIHWNHVDAQSDVFTSFAKLFLSYETGNAKPTAAAFHDVVTHFDCDPGQIVFFDDNAGNVAAAQQGAACAQPSPTTRKSCHGAEVSEIHYCRHWRNFARHWQQC